MKSILKKTIWFCKNILVLTGLLLLAGSCRGQELTYNLSQAIDQAKKNSLEYKIAANTIKSYYYNYQYYKSGFLPKLSITGSLPDYYNTINSIVLPDGQNGFVSQNVASSSLNLNLLQNIGLTGGTVSFSSSLQRIDNFGSFRNTAYTTVPFTLRYSQNNLFYNDFKWQKRIEPLKFKEAQRKYTEDLEGISVSTISKYFDLLLAQVQLKLDRQNFFNIDTLTKITQSRFAIGTVQLNEVLQSKISLLNAKKAVANSTLSLQTAQQNFVKYLNIEKKTQILLTVPDSLVFFQIDADIALEKAKANRKYLIEFERRLLTAEQSVAQVKSQTGPSINLQANIGLTQTGNSFIQAYSNLLRNQSLVVGFYIPLLDWGVNKSNRKRAEANLELEKNNISQETLTIEQEILYQVMKWNMQMDQMANAREASNLAQQRYNISKQKYSAGSMSFTDFNNAQLDKDKAVIDYIYNIYTYWGLFYNLRKITLFDFLSHKDIELTDILNLK